MELSIQGLSAAELPVASASDDELVARAAHDREAFAAIYWSHYRPIGSYLYRRTGDHHATEDLLNDVFLAALRGLKRYRARGLPLRAWLYRIATNEANRWARRRRRQPVLLGRDATSFEQPSGATPTASAESFARLYGALWSLPMRQQAVVALFYLEELSVEEIAEVLGTRAGTVKSRLARARAALRGKLEGRQ